MDADEESEFEETDNESDLTDDDSDEQEQNLSEAEELFESIKDSLASLFRLAVVIRNSSPRDRYARALGGKNPFNEQFDVAHVGEKFPKLNVDSNVWLKDRIGKAIAQRRQYLCYAREHRYKLGKEPVELWKPAVEVPKAFLQAQSQAARTSNSRPLTTVADTTASTLFLQETPQIEMDFRDDQSQTSFAFSKGGEESQDKIQLPRLSEVAKGQASFECPFCWTMQAIRKESAWRKHALADLRPYVCTFGNCDVKLFADRKTWFEHELQTHRATWRCHFCNHDDFPVKEALQNHMHHKHSQIGEDQLGALLDAGRRPNTFFKASDCDMWGLICKIWRFLRYLEVIWREMAMLIPLLALGQLVLSPVDLKACIEAINTSLSMPSPAFEEQLIAVLPGLSVPQFIGVKMSRDLSRRIKNLSDFRFRIIVEAACCGPTGANARWLRKWESSAPGSLTWLSIVIRILTKRYNFDTSEDFTDLNQRHRQYLGSLIGCPSWVINALEYVFAHGIAVTPGPIPEDRIMRDIDVLRASFAAIGRSNENPVIPQVSGVLGFQEAAWTLIVIKRWWRLYKQTKILEKLLTSISQDNPLLDGPAWLPVLSRYPIFTECPDFLDAVRPHIQLQGYDANQLILGKRDCSTSIGWLITGTTWYIATYNQNNQRREWVTEETGVTIGLVDTLFGLPSLIEHRTKTPCLLATLPNVTFNELAKSSPGVVEHITAKDFGASFDLTQECLRIEVEFGHPWWHIFHTLPSTEVNRAEVVARILQSIPDPQVILLLQRTIDNIQHTPLDLAADIDDIETAKVLLEYGAPVLLQTVRIVLRNSNLEFMELILNRRGAAEAANRLLRNGNKEDVAKFQNLLKELQGSVPVNLAVERDYNVALVEPRDISEGEIEAPDEDTNEPDDLILEDDIPFSRDDFAAAIENCFKNDDATTESTSHVGQLLEAFPDKATASAFLNSIALYNDGGFSPVTGAIKHDRLELLAILLKNDIDTNAADANGLYPLDLAMSSTERRTEKCVLLLDHGATKSSQDRRAELAQLKEQIRIAKDHGSEWSEILQRAATSEESLALVQNILEKAEHPRLTANILLPSGQTALDVAIAQNNADLVLLLLQHEAWPAENSALVAAEANSDLDPRIVGAMRKHLPVAFKNSTAAQAIKSEAPDENANGNEGTDTEAEQTTAGEHNDNSQKAPIDTDEKAQIDANEIEDEPMTADTGKLDYESTAAHADTTQETCQSSSGPGLAEQATQVAVHEKAQTGEQVKIG
ncbi:hypothetical protein SNOG_14413 [Parastagonospora nodorum SN15]|uniref:C2H2-type domain-containing protein n=1 Tax=Phaeosphaeria nodorum (strain SN15 / ATCC MYA-4574 / FGSC 10173) TaxID=321614 RepID=Q0U1N7_PHANO|nr:hypothetical protein SNOG_14413 [Parastagonospora nodorum SN15]EAT78284.2 hypothetical protein SNOG_14413 [Parastagonospora nodorum SN15]